MTNAIDKAKVEPKDPNHCTMNVEGEYLTWRELKEYVNKMRDFELDVTVKGFPSGGSEYFVENVDLDKNGDTVLILG